VSEQVIVDHKITLDIDVDQDILRKYNKHCIRDYKSDPYYIKLVELHGY